MTNLASVLTTRAYGMEDEAEVLELLSASLGGGPGGHRPSAFFRWKHVDNPFGQSFMLVGKADGRIVGFRAFLRWRFRNGGRTLQAVRAVDTATHPEFQEMGVFSRLTREALETLRHEVDLVFNTPNRRSLPGYLKMGWRTAGKVPVSVRARRPLRLASWALATRAGETPRPDVHAATAGEALGDERVVNLLQRSETVPGRLATPRDLEYLRWRYASAPLLDYRAVVEEEDGGLEGLAIFRVRLRGRLWESTVSEVLVAPGDRAAAGRLLRGVRRAARVDHLTCSFPPRSAARSAARTGGFVRAPGGMTFVVNPLRSTLDPDPSFLESWALSLGDLEVF